ncbi:uncharacterized protein FIBRA_02444 [Fibroporia radiculosa]|uniref:Uncharacterized protein n=1 Tax=Fibroporia radiculosa TaxID=599839 RepID=J4H1V1_9APHY|nr:uncharacterized protein FIBRA_02444 [Fibroporia radiculosa]CCM00414.1 predicted protein [Fibroporia radiculosa]
MSEPQSSALRIVPGAPPPAPQSKLQKKKRKATKAKSAEPSVVDESMPDVITPEAAPIESGVKESVAAVELVAQQDEAQTPVEEGSQKPSPIIEMLSKRLKAIQKKITRIEIYSSEPPEKLNDDQKRLLKTLPGLEAVRKELEEVKKAISVHEAEVAQEYAVKQAEAIEAERQRLLEAVVEAEVAQRRKSANMLHLLRLRDRMASGNPAVMALDLDGPEGAAIYSAADTLVGDDSDSRMDFISGFLSGEGVYRDVPYSRLHDIVQLFLSLLPVITPVEEVQDTDTVDRVIEETSQVDVGVTGLPPVLASSGSFHFMQEDELESQTPESDSAERPQRDDLDSQLSAEPSTEVEIVEALVETEANSQRIVQEAVSVTTITEAIESVGDGAINWADEDEGGLPSIGSLHAEFGKPDISVPNSSVPSTPVANGARLNGQHAIARDDDGFSHARGRGRGRGGFRVAIAETGEVIVGSRMVNGGVGKVSIAVGGEEVVVEDSTRLVEGPLLLLPHRRG